MADDIIKRGAERLFQKYCRIFDITRRKNFKAPASKDFKHDFLSEVQKAAYKMAIGRTEEIQRQIEILTKRISETETSGNKFLTEILMQERNRLSTKLLIG